MHKTKGSFSLCRQGIARYLDRESHILTCHRGHFFNLGHIVIKSCEVLMILGGYLIKDLIKKFWEKRLETDTDNRL